jgi:hypothetical protein
VTCDKRFFSLRLFFHLVGCQRVFFFLKNLANDNGSSHMSRMRRESKNVLLFPLEDKLVSTEYEMYFCCTSRLDYATLFIRHSLCEFSKGNQLSWLLNQSYSASEKIILNFLKLCTRYFIVLYLLRVPMILLGTWRNLNIKLLVASC